MKRKFPSCDTLCVPRCYLFLLLTSIFVFCTFAVLAQETQKQITGKVTDIQSSLPLAGVSVAAKGRGAGKSTDSNGVYRINVPASTAVLVFTSIGYKSQEISIGERTTVDISLVSEAKSLDQVIVVNVGYGTLNKREVASAVTHLAAKDLLTGGNNNPLMSMQGRVAGLNITNTAAGDPNSTPSLQLRGVSSRSAGLGPLYVVNGVPGGNIDNINQNDIESIDILKGGAASAIYGTRGSNGVILITTKKGSSQSRMLYDGYTAFDYPTNTLKVLSRESFLAHNRGDDAGGNTDWMKAVSRSPAFSQKHTLQFSGAAGKTNYIASADYRDAQGIDLRSSKKEYGARVNINHTSASEIVSVSLNVAPRYANTSLADYGGFNWALTLNPTLPVYDSTGGYNYINGGLFANNPVEKARVEISQQEIKELDINGSVKVNILKNLSTMVTVGEVSGSIKSLYFLPSIYTPVLTIHGGNGRNVESQKQEENDQKSFEWVGNYSLNLSKHSFKLLAGYSYQQFDYQEFDAKNENQPFDAFTWNNLGAGDYGQQAGVNEIGSTQNSSKLIAFFGRLNYDFDKRYYLMASLRREGSTKFGEGNKWGYFPAASVAWRITEEKFMHGISWLNELKLRGDYGVTGNQDFNSYQSLLTYGGFGYFPFNGTTYQVYGPSQNVNPFLRWEKAINFNAGLDFELLQHRISGSLNYYIRTNKDLLGSYNVQVPPNAQPTTYVNVGSMKNSGLEIQLNGAVVRKKDFSYDISFTGATNNNNFVSFSNQLYNGGTFQDGVSMPSPGNPGNLERLQEGHRIGGFYTLHAAGIDNTGTLQVYNKDGKVILAPQATNDDRRFTGNGLPKFTASMGNNFRYKDWDLGIFFRGAFGYQLFNTFAFYLGTPAQQTNVNLLTSAYDAGSKYSKLTNPASSAILSDYFIEPGSFVKLDNISLGYTRRLTAKYIHSVRIYATGRNLHTFTKYTGGDPDLVQTNGLWPGVQQDGGAGGTLNYFPSTLQVLVGLQVIF